MTVLRKDVIMGTFTHRDTLYPRLQESVERLFPDIQFIVQLDNLPINANMEALRQKFIASGKRYWIFLDDDIVFLENNTIDLALELLVSQKFGMVGIYSTYDPNYVLGSDQLKAQSVNWIPGYFQLVDSRRVGHISPALDLPAPNTGIDTNYSVSIRTAGFSLGIAPSVCFHLWKAVPVNVPEYLVTKDYVEKRWGRWFNYCCGPIPNIVGRRP